MSYASSESNYKRLQGAYDDMEAPGYYEEDEEEEDDDKETIEEEIDNGSIAKDSN